MRQVPASSERSGDQSRLARYLVVGGGRLARHLVHYLTLENLPVSQVSSRDEFALGDATHVLLAVSDSAIEEVAARVRAHVVGRSIGSMAQEIQFVHFSGALVLEGVPSAHPLMTFGTELYSHDVYRSIPFIIESGGALLDTLLPGLPNASYAIDAHEKPLYHALCSVGGNFTVLLWEKVFASFTSELGLPREVLYPFLTQTASNLQTGADTVLTGPLARRDFGTIEKHLAALDDDPFAEVYRAFVRAYLASKTADGTETASVTDTAAGVPSFFPLGGSL